MSRRKIKHGWILQDRGTGKYWSLKGRCGMRVYLGEARVFDTRKQARQVCNFIQTVRKVSLDDEGNIIQVINGR